MPLDTTAAIETPEHVVFDVRVAGPIMRGLAYLIDFAIRFGVMLVLGIGVLISAGGNETLLGFAQGVGLIVWFVLEWGYPVLFEMLWNGQTPGKRALSLRVVKDSGSPINVGDSLLRNLLRAADFLPMTSIGLGLYGVGLVCLIADPRFRRLGDLVAGTMVVHEVGESDRRRLQIHPPPTDIELAAVPTYPALTGDEKSSIEAFLLRIGTLSPAREEELAAILSEPLRRRLGCPAPHSPSRFLALIYWRATMQGSAYRR